MADIEHNVITDPNIHEPKGISTASLGQVYLSDGAGSGSWVDVGGTNSFIYVSDAADFPTQDGSTITLEADNVYLATSDIVTSKNFICEDGASVTSLNPLGSTLTYSGSGNMFSGTNVSFNIFNINLDCPAGTLFNFEDDSPVNTNTIITENIRVISCIKTGTFTSLDSLIMDDVTIQSANSGVTLAGLGWDVWRLKNFIQISTSASFVGFELGVAQADSIIFSNLTLDAPAGAVGISGTSSSGNVPTGSLGKIRDVNFLGGITDLAGITRDDIRWSLRDNTGIQDTMPDAMVSLNNNVTATVIASSSTPVKIAGTWVLERESHFTGDTTGRVTYDGERDITTPVDVSASIEPVSGTNVDIKMYLALNGTVIANTGRSVRVSSSDPQNFSTMWQLILSTNDYLEVFVENNSGTTNLQVNDAILRIR